MREITYEGRSFDDRLTCLPLRYTKPTVEGKDRMFVLLRDLVLGKQTTLGETNRLAGEVFPGNTRIQTIRNAEQNNFIGSGCAVKAPRLDGESRERREISSPSSYY